ncbi:unnamed protein product, partial [Rotaria sordida]
MDSSSPSSSSSS